MKNKLLILIGMFLFSLTFVSAESCVGISFEECVTYEGCSWIEEGNCADLVDEETCEETTCVWEQLEQIGSCLIYNQEDCELNSECSWYEDIKDCNQFDNLQYICSHYVGCTFTETGSEYCFTLNEEECNFFSNNIPPLCSWDEFMGCEGGEVIYGTCDGTYDNSVCDGTIWSYGCGGGTYDINSCEGEYELQVEQPQGIIKFWKFDKLSPTGEVTSENGQARIGLFSSIGNFFLNIWNWFKGVI